MTKRRKPKKPATSRLLLTPERVAGATIIWPEADLDEPRKRRPAKDRAKGGLARGEAAVAAGRVAPHAEEARKRRNADERGLGTRLAALLNDIGPLTDEELATIEGMRHEVPQLQQRIAELESENALFRKLVISNDDVAAGRTRPAAEVIDLIKSSHGRFRRDLDAVVDQSIERQGTEFERLRDRVDELERRRIAHLNWLYDVVKTLESEEAVAEIRRYLGDTEALAREHQRLAEGKPPIGDGD